MGVLTDIFSVKGKTVLVTGGSRGIGKLIVEGYMAFGAKKVYITSRKADVCDEVAKAFSKTYVGDCISLPKDLSTYEAVQGFCEDFKRNEKYLDILVNNAGFAWGEGFDSFPEIGFDKVMNLNVKTLFFLTQGLAGLLEKSSKNQDDPSRVINIGSIDGLNVSAIPNYTYGASKAAVHHLTRILAKELVSKPILVNAIAPGPFKSEMLGKALDHNYEVVEKANPRGRVGSLEDMAGLCVFLSSRASAYLTGAVIACDGGASTLASNSMI